jgi:hypothetical protein
MAHTKRQHDPGETAETDAAKRRMLEKLNEATRKRYAAKQKRAKAKTVRKGTQAKRKASRSPGGYQAGSSVETLPNRQIFPPSKAAHAKLKIAKAARVRKGTQAKRQATRSPKPKRHFVEGAVGYDPDWKAKRAAMQKKAKAAKIAAAKPVRKGKQAKRKASRSPGGFAGGGTIETYSAQVQRKYGGGKI